MGMTWTCIAIVAIAISLAATLGAVVMGVCAASSVQ